MTKRARRGDAPGKMVFQNAQPARLSNPTVKISIVIPAFNEEKLIASTLAAVAEAVRAFADLGWAAELVVCDNNSTDKTGAIAREHGAVVVFEPQNQIARARNTGAKAATGDWLVFVDADSRPSRELFADMAAQIQKDVYIGGGSAVRMDESHLALNLLTGVWNLISRLNKWAAGSFIFCQAEAFRAIGGFDLELYASEEIEFSKRLKKLGRQRGKGFVILRKHPLLTSARKVHLYGKKEYASLFAKLIFSPNRGVRNRQTCHVWYDGRR